MLHLFQAVFFSSVFFLVGGGFFLVFVLAVVSVCVRHVYKSQSASHSPFFHLLATLLPSPEQARHCMGMCWVGKCLPLPSAPFHWGGGWLINASGLGNIAGADVALSRARKFFSHIQGMPDACHALVSADTWCSSSGDA